MTLIVWDGATLAADKLRSHGGNSIKSRSVSTVNKIVVFDEKKTPYINAVDIKMKPTETMMEQLLAIATTGSVDKINSFYQFINLPAHDEYSLPYSVRMNLFLESLKPTEDLGLMMLTADLIKETPITICRYNPVHGRHRLVPAGNFQAIGSGAPLARVLHRQFGLNAIELIQLVSLFERTVGNGIDYLIPVKGPELKTLWDYDSEDRERHIRLISNFIRKGKLSKHPNL